jgi:hypothetical protein
LRRTRHGRASLLLIESRSQIGTRRNHGARGGLTRERALTWR